MAFIAAATVTIDSMLNVPPTLLLIESRPRQAGKPPGSPAPAPGSAQTSPRAPENAIQMPSGYHPAAAHAPFPDTAVQSGVGSAAAHLSCPEIARREDFLRYLLFLQQLL
jgi:hypothetical protein